MLKGIGASPGIVIGKVYLLDRRKVKVEKNYIVEEQISQEIKRFKEAIANSSQQLEKIKEELASKMGDQSHNYIIDSHLMILRDQLLIQDTINTIEKEKVNAEWRYRKLYKVFLTFLKLLKMSTLKSVEVI